MHKGESYLLRHNIVIGELGLKGEFEPLQVLKNWGSYQKKHLPGEWMVETKFKI